MGGGVTMKNIAINLETDLPYKFGQSGIYVDFTDLEQALINTGWSFWRCASNDSKFKWIPPRSWRDPWTDDNDGYIFVDLKGKPRLPVTYYEYHSPFGTRSSYVSYEGTILPAHEFSRIPAEDGGSF